MIFKIIQYLTIYFLLQLKIFPNILDILPDPRSTLISIKFGIFSADGNYEVTIMTKAILNWNGKVIFKMNIPASGIYLEI